MSTRGYDLYIEIDAGAATHLMMVTCGADKCFRLIYVAMRRGRGGVYTASAKAKIIKAGWDVQMQGVCFCPDHKPKKATE